MKKTFLLVASVLMAAIVWVLSLPTILFALNLGKLATESELSLNMLDPNERLFDCPQKATFALAQVRLEGHPRSFIRPIGKISGTSLCPSRIE